MLGDLTRMAKPKPAPAPRRAAPAPVAIGNARAREIASVMIRHDEGTEISAPAAADALRHGSVSKPIGNLFSATLRANVT